MNQPSNAPSLVGLASAARMSLWGSATRECGRQPMLRASVRASSMYSPREKTATGRQITMMVMSLLIARTWVRVSPGRRERAGQAGSKKALQGRRRCAVYHIGAV